MATKKVSFKEKLDELDNIVSKMDRGEEDLDTMLSLYEKANKLIKELEEDINKAKAKINEISK